MTLLIHLRRPWSLQDKILVFHCRVDVWLLGPAVEILKEIEGHEHPSAWSHSAYGLLSVVMSYFEMIGKTLNPKSARSNTASVDFNYGFCDVYDGYRPASGNYSDYIDAGQKKKIPNPDMEDVKQFRNRLRNGLYHLAATKEDLWIHNRQDISEKDFDIIPAYGDRYYVNPHSMVRTIVNHFPTFIERLRNPDPQYDTMRAKFEDFIDNYQKV